MTYLNSYLEDFLAVEPDHVLDLEEHILAVKKGAAHLDQVQPLWPETVRIRSLDLSSGCNCVLGQLYSPDDSLGNYGFMLNEVCPFPRVDYMSGNEVDAWAVEHGFDVRPSVTGNAPYQSSAQRQSYRLLTALWRDELVARGALP